MNDPIMYAEPSGHSVVSAIIIGAMIGFVTTGIKYYVNDGKLFNGDISSFGDVMIQFALGGVLGGVGYGIGKGITNIFADKKIFVILGNLSDNAKVNKRLAKAGFGYLKIGKHGFSAVYDELYKKLGYGIVENSINSSYDFVVGLVF